MFYKLFKTMKYFFENTRNNRVEKEWVFKFFDNKIYPYRNKLVYMNKYFEFTKNTLDLFLECVLFSKDEKMKLIKFKNMLLEMEIRLGN